MSRPLLDVVTRHIPSPRRAELLARQQASLLAWGSADWVQTLLVDPHVLGVPASHRRLRTYEPAGQYVWVLDDDDVCIAPDLLTRIDREAECQVFRMRHGGFGVLPDDLHWRQHIIALGQVGPPCLVVRRDLWLATRHAWGDRYEGDYDFAAVAVQAATSCVWTDLEVARIDEVGGGRR